MKKRMILALILAVCLVLPAVVSAAELAPLTVAVYKMQSLPGDWNPLEEQTGDGALLLSLTTDHLYRLSSDGTQLLPAMAAALPQDVTAELAGTYGIPAGAKRNYAYRIDLAPEAAWEDGTPISADDWLFTLNLLIDLERLGLELAGLEDYYNEAEKPAENVISLMEAGFSSVEEAQAAGYQQFYVDTTHFWGLDTGWVSAQSRTRLKDAAIPSGVTEMYLSGAYLYERYLRTGAELSLYQPEFVGVSAEPAYTSRADIGLISSDPHQIVLVLDQPATAETVALKLMELTVLRQDLFGSDYATSMQTYSSCGPWKIVSIASDAIILEPNAHWQGQRQAVDRIQLTA